MKPIVILVHGMGSHAKGAFTKEFRDGVNETARNFSIANFDIADRAHLVEFNYDHILDAIRNKIASNAQSIRDQGFGILTGAGVDLSIVTALTDYESNFKNDRMFATHWLDVILYGSTHFGEMIRIEFARLLNKQIRDADGAQIHIISHSLGTAVVHDAMAKLYRKEADITDQITDLIPGAFNVDSIWTFANVSRLVNLLNGLQDPMTSIVTTGENGCTEQFFNIRHVFDPFTWFKTYDRQMDDAVTYENKVVRKWNTHDFAEYVADPYVCRRLLNVLTRREKQNDIENFNACREKHQENTMNAAIDKFELAAESFKNKPISSFKQALDAIQEVLDIVKEMREEMTGEEAADG